MNVDWTNWEHFCCLPQSTRWAYQNEEGGEPTNVSRLHLIPKKKKKHFAKKKKEEKTINLH